MQENRIKACHLGFLDHASHEPELVDLGIWIAAAYSNRTPERTWNEDSLALLAIEPQTVIMAIADGAGGHNHGREASQQVIREVLTLASPQSGPTSAGWRSNAIIDSFDRANDRVRELGGGACTTLSLVEINGRSFRSYHSGDSKALVVGRKGKLKYQTINHGPLELGLQCGFLQPDQEENLDYRSLVTNMVGSRDTTLEVSAAHQIDRFDMILVGSDGLFDNLPAPEICAIIHGQPVEKAASALVAKARQCMAAAEKDDRYKIDDLSFILIGVKEN